MLVLDSTNQIHVDVHLLFFVPIWLRSSGNQVSRDVHRCAKTLDLCEIELA